MSYSIIGLLAIFIHLIINRDVLWKTVGSEEIPAFSEYRSFILGIIVFCVTDVLWGFMDEHNIKFGLYAVTVFFFVAMMAGFLLCTRYVAAYMDSNTAFRKFLSISGLVLFCAEIVILIINFFVPIQFRYDGNGVYHAGCMRYATLGLQVIMFVLTSVYTFITQAKTPEATKRLRRTVGFFGLAMAALIVLQMYYPLLPLYSIGYLIGSCLAHTFVVEDEKDEYRKTIEEMLRREKLQNHELVSSKNKIYTDPLTGLGSQQAYIDDKNNIDQFIKSGERQEFAVAVFDLNNLKLVNDTMGHDTGDKYIAGAGALISEFFPHSPVYRIGGDEFAVILIGKDFERRAQIFENFNKRANENKAAKSFVVAAGMSEYIFGKDPAFLSVFERADRRMYQKKKELKLG